MFAALVCWNFGQLLHLLLNAGKPGGIPNNYASGPMPQGGAMNSFVPQQQAASEFRP